MKTAKLPLYYIGMLLMALPFFFTSCSSDDDGYTSSDKGSDTAGQITGSDHEVLYITSVGDNTFSYNSEGKITKCRAYGSDDYIFSYNPFKISYTHTHGSYSDVTEYYDISLNKNGYIVYMKTRDTDYSDNDENNGEARFSYDSKGHLTKIASSGTDVYYEDGEKITEKYSLEYNLSWSNGKLTQIVCSGNEDGEKYTDTATFEYGDDTYPNITKQWTDNYMADMIEDMEFLFYVGYFGVAGDYHPVSATQHDSDGETTTFKYSYEFNDNGSVKASKYKYNNNRYWTTRNFTYMSK